MRRWLSAPTETFCTACGAAILAHERYQSLTLPGVSRVGKRCRTCADETPELQGEPMPRPPLGVDFTRIGDVHTPNTWDHKAKRLGAG